MHVCSHVIHPIIIVLGPEGLRLARAGAWLAVPQNIPKTAEAVIKLTH